ncbi:MAG TPA: Crp/Fnr family transcriptional regulator [Gemmatimonadaceae bacterium]
MDESAREVRSVLEHIPLFASFGGAVLERLAQRSVVRAYPAGSVLFTTGEPCRGLYVIATGRVKIYRTSPTGREQVLQSEGPGRPVAELPLFDGGPYPASAVTEEDSRLIFVPLPEFEALYERHPEVARAVIRNLGSRLRHLVHVTETLAFRDVAARLAHYLADYAEQHARKTDAGFEFTLPRTQEELSFELGTARESVSRAFKQLSEKGVIVMLPRRKIRVPDLLQLRTLGRPGERPHFE